MRTIRHAIVLTIAAAAVLAPAAAAATTGAARGTALAGAAGTSVAATNQLGNGTVSVINGSATKPAAFNSLAGVSCVSGSFCMAVGGFLSPTVTASSPPGIIRPLAEEWNGSGWRVLRSAGAVGGGLEAVSCRSVSFCMAVGDADSVAGASLAEAWNGSAWRVVKTPPGGIGLAALSCATASFCVAVPSNTVTNVAEEWNGRAWHLMNMSGDGCVPFYCVLYGVSCPSAQDCMAVGTYANHAGTVVLGKALKWNGRTWRRLRPAQPGKSARALFGVSCWRRPACMAVGSYSTMPTSPSGDTLTLAEQWNGTTWRVRSTPQPR